MPKDTPGVELDQYQKEKDEFDEAMDEVFSAENEDKTNEEIAEELAKKDAKDQDGDGISTKDSDDEAAKKAKATGDSDLLTQGQGVAPDDGDASTTVTKTIEDPDDIDSWKAKVEALEAELTKEKQKTSSWNGRITAANKKVKDLETELETMKQAPAAAAADDGSKTKSSTESDNDVLDRFRNDFPEMGDVFDIMQKRIDGVSTAKAKDETDDDVIPTDHVGDDKTLDETMEEHAASIRKVHPDLSEMANTGVLLTWINKQPDFIRPALETIYKSGKAEDVINMVTEFKDKTGWISQLTKVDDKTKNSNDKLNSMLQVDSETTTPDGKTVDKNNFDQGAKDAGF